jgi:hypothetical protein
VISADGVVSAAVTPNAPLQPIAQGQLIAATAMIVTGLDGRALIDRAGDRIEITPGTRLQLEPQASTTSVLQRAGRAIYDIVTGGKPRFDVRTPFLVAGVKGTVFSVTVTTSGASVSVSEGVVGVSPPTPDGFDAADVGAGSSAAVSVAAAGLSITVEDTLAGRAPESLREVPPRREAGNVLLRQTAVQIVRQRSGSATHVALRTGAAAAMEVISRANNLPTKPVLIPRPILAAATTVAEIAAITAAETPAVTGKGAVRCDPFSPHLPSRRCQSAFTSLGF